MDSSDEDVAECLPGLQGHTYRKNGHMLLVRCGLNMAAIPFLLAAPRFIHALGPPIPGPARSMFFLRFNEESGRLDARYSASLDASHPFMALACQALPLVIATPNTARVRVGRNVMVLKGSVSLYVATIGASESSCLSKMPRAAAFGFRAKGRPTKNLVHASK